jgi:hypothetical protein
MKFLKILSEDRATNFKEKYGKKFDNTTLDRMVKLIPPKFLDWVGKVVDYKVIDDSFDQFLMELVDSINKFEKISSNLPKTDINQYQNLEELKAELLKYENRPRREYQEVEGGNLVYEDDRYYIVNPLTHSSSCYYGKGTKWCTAADSDHHFNQYNTDGKLFYIIDKKLPTNDVNYKIAILQKFDGESTFWNAKDDKLTEDWFVKHNPLAKKITSEIQSYLETEFKEQLEIFKDKERARKEIQRLEKLRRQRIIEQEREDANERRVNGDWNLSNPNIDKEGLCANALLDYIINYDNLQKLGPEEKQRKEFLLSEIEKLNNEYDESEDTRTDILDMIQEMEDELEELNTQYIDVYNLIPDYSYYDLLTFHILGDPEEKKYAVGTEDDMEESAKEYAQGLIDDVGYEGFSKSFVEDYIDEEQVADYFRSFYEDDIYDEPSNYFEESQRDLSREQKSQIEVLNNKISTFTSSISNLNEMINQMDDEERIEELSDKVEELESEIEDLQIEIEEIQEDPEGDFPQDLIDEKVDELVDDVRNSPITYLKDFGMEINNFINRTELIEGLIQSDGYGIINSYSGDYDTQDVNGETFYMMRIE